MRNDSGTAVTPLTANVVVTPPPSTVSGAEAATVKKTMCTTPSRRRRSRGSVDEIIGRLRCSVDLLRGGLVGAELAELVIAGRLGVTDGRVHPLDADAPDSTRLAAEYVVECVLGQPRRHTVRTWTDNLGEPLQEM